MEANRKQLLSLQEHAFLENDVIIYQVEKWKLEKVLQLALQIQIQKAKIAKLRDELLIETTITHAEIQLLEEKLLQLEEKLSHLEYNLVDPLQRSMFNTNHWALW
uniref:Uncharacterized protein n=1 Tax=Strigamia maritima TaxID=126957 RepID=T1JJT0_STRMM